MTSAKYSTLYLVRHGETEWNVRRLIQGHSDSKLTPTGITQARVLGESLRHIQFDAIFSSDLYRAQQTAELIALERKLAVQTTKLLRERMFGRFEGKTFEEYNRELRDLLQQQETLGDDQRRTFKLAPDVESDAEVISRFITSLREIAVAYSGKTVLVVSHGGCIRQFLMHIGFAPYRSLYPGAVSNAAYIRMETDGVEFIIKHVVGVNKESVKEKAYS